MGKLSREVMLLEMNGRNRRLSNWPDTSWNGSCTRKKMNEMNPNERLYGLSGKRSIRQSLASTSYGSPTI
jgi:hypothetical protein